MGKKDGILEASVRFVGIDEHIKKKKRESFIQGLIAGSALGGVITQLVIRYIL